MSLPTFYRVAERSHAIACDFSPWKTTTKSQPPRRGMRVGGCRGGIHMPSLRDSIVAAEITPGLNSRVVACHCSAVHKCGSGQGSRLRLTKPTNLWPRVLAESASSQNPTLACSVDVLFTCEDERHGPIAPEEPVEYENELLEQTKSGPFECCIHS